LGEKEILEEISQTVVEGDAEKTVDLVKKALEQKIDPLKILEEGLAKGVRYVGDAFGRREMFLTDLAMAGEAMKAGTEVVTPHLLAGEAVAKKGKLLIATVEGDIHDIGKSIVATMLAASGFEVVDLGIDIPSSVIVQKVGEIKPDILGLSALMTTTKPKQREVVEELKKAGLRDKVKVILGGAPITPEWTEEAGADGYGRDAVHAVEVAKRLLGAE